MTRDANNRRALRAALTSLENGYISAEALEAYRTLSDLVFQPDPDRLGKLEKEVQELRASLRARALQPQPVRLG